MFRYLVEHLKAIKSHSDASIRRKLRANSMISADRPSSTPLQVRSSASDVVSHNGKSATSRRFSVDPNLLNSDRSRTRSEGALKQLTQYETPKAPLDSSSSGGERRAEDGLSQEASRLSDNSSGDHEVFDDSLIGVAPRRRSESPASDSHVPLKPAFVLTVDREESRESMDQMDPITVPFACVDVPDPTDLLQLEDEDRLNSGGFNLEEAADNPPPLQRAQVAPVRRVLKFVIFTALLCGIFPDLCLH